MTPYFPSTWQHSLVYRNRDGTVVPWLVEEVNRLSPGGKGVDVAYDSVGEEQHPSLTVFSLRERHPQPHRSINRKPAKI